MTELDQDEVWTEDDEKNFQRARHGLIGCLAFSVIVAIVAFFTIKIFT